MAAQYPNAIKTFTNPAPGDPRNSPSHSQQHDDVNDEVHAMQTELGVNPKGSYADVVTRLAAMSAAAGLGARVSKSFSTNYQATTDGVVTGYTNAQQHNGSFAAYTDSANPPTTKVQGGSATFVSGSPGNSFPISFHVIKNEYYRVTESDGVGGVLFFQSTGS